MPPASAPSARAIKRGLAYIRKLQRPDGGFALVPGRSSDSQSTAWAIQAYLAAGKKPPAGATTFLGRMLRPDGSYRYSKQYADDAAVGDLAGAARRSRGEPHQTPRLVTRSRQDPDDRQRARRR